MPELPEVETVRRGLAPHLEGALIEEVLLRRKDLRFAFPDRFAQRLVGQTVVNIGRRAKYLLFTLSGGETILSHLGMTGNYRFAEHALAAPSRYRTPSVDQKHDHLILYLNRQGEKVALIYSDPRRFGFVDMFADADKCRFLAHLGPEPLGNSLTAASLAERLRGRKMPAKSALLDQSIIAGLGNIYVSEALWRAGIMPDCPAGALVLPDGAPSPELEVLVKSIRDVLSEAIIAGGSTLRDFKNAAGDGGYFQHNFDVYDRAGEPCHKQACAGTIQRMMQSGRSSFYCAACQRTPLR